MAPNGMSRRLRLLATSAVLLANACGGGSTTGPNGGGGGGGGAGDGIAGVYIMVALGLASLPFDVMIEDCGTTRFNGGDLQLENDGTWKFAIDTEDENGPQEFDDAGEYELDGTTLRFTSETYGDSFTGKLDGTVARLDYDYCADGQSDIQFVFLR
jgi:hypothetical protein